MNETIQLLNNHRSVRKYTAQDVSDEQTRIIMETASAAPNWINGQQVSVIEVRDPEKKKQLAIAAGNQPWVAEAPVFFVFCLDFHRAKLVAEKNKTEFNIVDNIEAIIIGSTDAGIALANASAAAESMGLGIVPIGGIRREPQKVIDVLHLPDYVFPVSGLAVGYPAELPGQKPRLPLDAFHHKDTYQADQHHLIDQYDRTITEYMKERTGEKDSSDWSSKVAAFYDKGFAPYGKVASVLKKQGFHYE